MVLQMEADGAQGYDFVAYHGYGKRRYFELVDRKYFEVIKQYIFTKSWTLAM